MVESPASLVIVAFRFLTGRLSSFEVAFPVFSCLYETTYKTKRLLNSILKASSISRPPYHSLTPPIYKEIDSLKKKIHFEMHLIVNWNDRVETIWIKKIDQVNRIFICIICWRNLHTLVAQVSLQTVTDAVDYDTNGWSTRHSDQQHAYLPNLRILAKSFGNTCLSRTNRRRNNNFV